MFSDQSSAFVFNFNTSDDSVEDTMNKSDIHFVKIENNNDNRDWYRGVVLNDFMNANMCVKRDMKVLIDWNRSSHFGLYILVDNTDICGHVPPIHVAFIVPEGLTIGMSDSPTLVHYDSVFCETRELTAHPHYISTPLAIEPGLSTLIWPLTSGEFLRRVYRERAFVVQGATERLALLRADFDNFDVNSMVHNASRIIVWMRSVADGRMNYVNADGNPGVAMNCYNAGHSLYFNPPMHVQRRYIQSLAVDLGIDFGAEKAGEFGGDIEVFAVRARHHTPWHYDSQHNFTIQLRGTKRWSVVAHSELSDPKSNLHPHSTNRSSILRDMYLHRVCTNEELPTTSELNERCETFLLRPGSVCYFPAGMWHQVYADDADGSLSINFSMDTARWSDVLMSRLQCLLNSSSEWRACVHVANVEDTRQHFQKLLDQLVSDLGNLDAHDFLPDVMFRQNRVPLTNYNSTNNDKRRPSDDGDTIDVMHPRVEIDATEITGESVLNDTVFDCEFARNPLAVLVDSSVHYMGNRETRPQSSKYRVMLGESIDTMLDQHTIEICFPPPLEPVFSRLSKLRPRESTSAKCVAESTGCTRTEAWHILGRLANCGYLRESRVQ